MDNNVEGKVIISFDVDETGKIYRPMVVSSKLGYGLEEAALKIVKEMPQWNPGKMNGKNVKTKFKRALRKSARRLALSAMVEVLALRELRPRSSGATLF